MRLLRRFAPCSDALPPPLQGGILVSKAVSFLECRGCSVTSFLATAGNTSADCFASGYAPRRDTKRGEAIPLV